MQILLSLIVALAAALLGPKFLGPYLPQSLQSSAPVAEKAVEPEVKETAFQRVMRTGTINCGYFIWPPYVMKDPNTGAISGVNYEYVEALGRLLNLKINWAQEISVGQVSAELNANKFDMMCSSVWPDAGRMKNLAHTIPSLYSNIYAWVRADDERFLSGDVNKANSPDVTLAVLDGDITQDVARSDFPQAKTYSLPQTADFSALIEAVATKKADMITIDDGVLEPYLKANPGKLRKVSPQPLKVFGENFPVKLGEHDFVNMLDTAMTILNNSPLVEEILKKYPSSMVPATRTYDATWLERRPTPTPAAEVVKVEDVPAPAEPAAEPATAPKPDDAALEKAPEAADKAKTEEPAAKPAAKPADDATKATASDDDKAVDEAVAPKAEADIKADTAPAEDKTTTEPTVKSEAEPKTDSKAESAKTEKPAPVTDKAVKKAATKAAAPPAPTLGDVKDALQQARKAAAAKAAEATSLPPGVTAPQPLTGAGATNGIISPSLPEGTISPTSTQ